MQEQNARKPFSFMLAIHTKIIFLKPSPINLRSNGELMTLVLVASIEFNFLGASFTSTFQR